MKNIHLICVGKLKDSHLLSVEQSFLKRIKGLKIYEVKTHEENLDKEAQEVLSQIKSIGSNPLTFLLTERGQTFDSLELANFFQKKFDLSDHLILVIGGASGHGSSLYSMATGQLSLSRLTFPHQLARILLVEQIYRVQTIWNQHPYHK